eukprot:snap_masked-scaffold_1-processed-gene-20.36-mRNA-1 protein AED:1.00 eAED:1.00 QI:0/-1/0/0/-1/1/1/0/1418
MLQKQLQSHNEQFAKVLPYTKSQKPLGIVRNAQTTLEIAHNIFIKLSQGNFSELDVLFSHSLLTEPLLTLSHSSEFFQKSKKLVPHLIKFCSKFKTDSKPILEHVFKNLAGAQLFPEELILSFLPLHETKIFTYILLEFSRLSTYGSLRQSMPFLPHIEQINTLTYPVKRIHIVDSIVKLPSILTLLFYTCFSLKKNIMLNRKCDQLASDKFCMTVFSGVFIEEKLSQEIVEEAVKCFSYVLDNSENYVQPALVFLSNFIERKVKIELIEAMFERLWENTLDDVELVNSLRLFDKFAKFSSSKILLEAKDILPRIKRIEFLRELRKHKANKVLNLLRIQFKESISKQEKANSRYHLLEKKLIQEPCIDNYVELFDFYQKHANLQEMKKAKINSIQQTLCRRKNHKFFFTIIENRSLVVEAISNENTLEQLKSICPDETRFKLEIQFRIVLQSFSLNPSFLAALSYVSTLTLPNELKNILLHFTEKLPKSQRRAIQASIEIIKENDFLAFVGAIAQKYGLKRKVKFNLIASGDADSTNKLMLCFLLFLIRQGQLGCYGLSELTHSSISVVVVNLHNVLKVSRFLEKDTFSVMLKSLSRSLLDCKVTLSSNLIQEFNNTLTMKSPESKELVEQLLFSLDVQVSEADYNTKEVAEKILKLFSLVSYQDSKQYLKLFPTDFLVKSIEDHPNYEEALAKVLIERLEGNALKISAKLVQHIPKLLNTESTLFLLQLYVLCTSTIKQKLSIFSKVNLNAKVFLLNSLAADDLKLTPQEEKLIVGVLKEKSLTSSLFAELVEVISMTRVEHIFPHLIPRLKEHPTIMKSVMKKFSQKNLEILFSYLLNTNELSFCKFFFEPAQERNIVQCLKYLNLEENQVGQIRTLINSLLEEEQNIISQTPVESFSPYIANLYQVLFFSDNAKFSEQEFVAFCGNLNLDVFVLLFLEFLQPRLLPILKEKLAQAEEEEVVLVASSLGKILLDLLQDEEEEDFLLTELDCLQMLLEFLQDDQALFTVSTTLSKLFLVADSIKIKSSKLNDKVLDVFCQSMRLLNPEQPANIRIFLKTFSAIIQEKNISVDFVLWLINNYSAFVGNFLEDLLVWENFEEDQMQFFSEQIELRVILKNVQKLFSSNLKTTNCDIFKFEKSFEVLTRATKLAENIDDLEETFKDFFIQNLSLLRIKNAQESFVEFALLLNPKKLSKFYKNLTATALGSDEENLLAWLTCSISLCKKLGKLFVNDLNKSVLTYMDNLDLFKQKISGESLELLECCFRLNHESKDEKFLLKFQNIEKEPFEVVIQFIKRSLKDILNYSKKRKRNAAQNVSKSWVSCLVISFSSFVKGLSNYEALSKIFDVLLIGMESSGEKKYRILCLDILKLVLQGVDPEVGSMMKESCTTVLSEVVEDTDSDIKEIATSVAKMLVSLD